MRNGGSKHGRSRKQRQQKSSSDLPPLGRSNTHTNHAGRPEAYDGTHDNTEDYTGQFSGGGTHGNARTRTKTTRGGSILPPSGVRVMKATTNGVKAEANGCIAPITGEGLGEGRVSKVCTVYSSVKEAACDGYLHGETKEGVEVEREANASKKDHPEVEQDKSPDSQDIETAAAACPSGMEMARIGVENHDVGESTRAPTEDFIAPTEESMVHIEESAAPPQEPPAPTEESMAPTEEEGPLTTTNTSGIGRAPAEESSIGIPVSLCRGTIVSYPSLFPLLS